MAATRVSISGEKGLGSRRPLRSSAPCTTLGGPYVIGKLAKIDFAGESGEFSTS